MWAAMGARVTIRAEKAFLTFIARRIEIGIRALFGGRYISNAVIAHSIAGTITGCVIVAAIYRRFCFLNRFQWLATSA